jgi:hypothetical protein
MTKLTVRVEEEDHYQEVLITHDGKTVIPAEFRCISRNGKDKISLLHILRIYNNDVELISV